MATITINIGNDGQASVSAPGNFAPAAINNDTDGGASKAGGENAPTGSSSFSDLDIGAPPSWLIDAVGAEKKSSGENLAATAVAAAASTDAEDGGEAKAK